MEKGFDFSIEPDAELLHIALEPTHEGNRFNGQLRGGHLTLSARTRKLKWGEMGVAHVKKGGGLR